MLKHIGTESIKTERLLLRRYCSGDAADIFRNYASDERVTKYLSWTPYTSVEALAGFVAVQTARYSGNVYNWVIEYQGQAVGSISVTAIDERNESCEIGYCLGYAFWNKGLMTEAVVAVLEFLLCVAGFHRVMAKHDVDNPASGKIMVKCNMTYEGKLREHYLRHDGTYSDALVYSILKSDFSDV